MSDFEQQPKNDLIGDILKDYSKTGGMDNLKGTGEKIPKEYFSGDTFQHFQKIAKDAGYKPQWLKLQHEISDRLQGLENLETAHMKKEVSKINKKIAEHNKSCPPSLQKMPVSADDLETARRIWG
ncbi:hypothetical protein KP77_09330 [Jeotgalibacillus alimentarius]|uniref:DnaJ homologue subfamily C member 28 conserved domain-containing protein n=1 Tax=Jeotgalibacillus alimentarius TaxID=135826 RepID=A0A0C2W489_9BACL|nr:DnaJ family domain-containing protein [Jeotgalibacillus alimentarius]KIL51421.1 hypothetical protein KP77_09330 [Jeotgalibacillus alimentarius]